MQRITFLISKDTKESYEEIQKLLKICAEYDYKINNFNLSDVQE